MLANIAHEAGIPLVIDNTMATPVMCQPGHYGADIIVYSTTKFLSDMVMRWAGRLWIWAILIGFPAAIIQH